MEALDMRYRKLNDELRMLLFVTEKVCGMEQGGGKVFKEHRKYKEVVDARHIFSYLAVVYLEYSHHQVKEIFSYKHTSNVSHGIGRIKNMVRYNRAYRNRVYNIAVECGIWGAVERINAIEKK